MGPFDTLDKLDTGRLPSRGLGTGRAGSLAMWFVVDKSGGACLYDWEVKIADFVPSTAKPTSLRVWLRLGMRRDRCFVGERCEKRFLVP